MSREKKSAEKTSLINFLSISDLCLCLEELLVEYKRKRKVVEICYKFGEFPTCGRHTFWKQLYSFTRYFHFLETIFSSKNNNLNRKA